MTLTQQVALRRMPGSIEQPDQLVVEEPLEIILRGCCDNEFIEKTVAITMRTPGDDAALAAGFLFTEGIIVKKKDIVSIELSESLNRVLIELRSDMQPELKTLERHFYTNSSCGVCGKTSLDALRAIAVYDVEIGGSSFDEAVLRRLPEYLLNGQGAFEMTGGAHASALFDESGAILDLAEDVGRHNALDKLIGRALLSGSLPLRNSGVLLSGRASFELLQKARMAATPMLVCLGAPSSLAVDLAWEAGMTLVGFLRAEGFNIYSYPSSISEGHS